MMGSLDHPGLRRLLKCIAVFIALLVPSCNEPGSMRTEGQLLSPRPGEILYTSTTYRIIWNAPDFGRVNIVLFPDAGSAVQVAADLENSGSFDWVLPGEMAEGSDYSIRITDPAIPESSFSSGKITIRRSGETSVFTDHRDGKSYRTVRIGNQWWMAENFNYASSDSYCYGDLESECDRYGRLYTLNTAIENAPPGWHLPDDGEWKQLEAYLGIEVAELDEYGRRGWFSGRLLAPGGGTGFDFQLGGYRNDCVGGRTGHKIWEGHYWTSSKTREGKPIIRILTNGSGEIIRLATICHEGCSVRYVKDPEGGDQSGSLRW